MNSRKTIRYTMEDVAPAVAMLQKGGLVALPTETVYGLAVNAVVRAPLCGFSMRSSSGSGKRPSRSW